MAPYYFTTVYQTAATFRAATKLAELDDTTRWDATAILGIANAAEKLVRGFGAPSTSSVAAQDAFDSACLEVMRRYVTEPSGASFTKTGEAALIFKPSDMPALENWKNSWAQGEGGGLQINHTRRYGH